MFLKLSLGKGLQVDKSRANGWRGNHPRFRGQQGGEKDGPVARRKSGRGCVTEAKRVFPGGSGCLCSVQLSIQGG